MRNRKSAMNRSRIARALLVFALAVLLGVSFATFDPGDWGKLNETKLLEAKVANSCGVVGAASSHFLLGALGLVSVWSVVILVTMLGMAGLWRVFMVHLLRWSVSVVVVAVLLCMGLAFVGPWGMVPVVAGGSLGVFLSNLGVQFLGKTGTAVFLLLAALLFLVYAFGDFMRRISFPGTWFRRPKTRKARKSRLGAREVDREIQDSRDPDASEIANSKEPVELPSLTQPKSQWPYRLPAVSVLRHDGSSARIADPKEVDRRKKKLEQALESFGVKATVVRAAPGPVITRYEVEPAPGVKVARIAALSHDLARALKALLIRVVAPIPGTEVVGIEVPNQKPSIVRLGDIVRSPDFQGSVSQLALPLGRDTVGDPVVFDLATLPHLLIGGTTGSGKSSCINAFICGLLMRVTPHTVRLILIDPKRVELMGYSGIPHLLHPVVTDPKVALRILGWAIQEMEKRYETLSQKGLRDIRSFHSTMSGNGNPMPYIVIIIDELADLMMTAPGEIEGAIIRIAQKARAVGIHLIVATQRPSKEIVTGVLKSNFPGRIAFQVMQKVNSNIILDSPGAEKLLGRGDMLFLPPGAPAPRRIHGAYITPEEVNNIVEFWKNQENSEKLDPEEKFPPLAPEDLKEDELTDPMWEEAARLIILNNQGSTSLIQRRLKVGYARAGRLMDILENKGVVGPPQGSKPREILVDASWLETSDIPTEKMNKAATGRNQIDG